MQAIIFALISYFGWGVGDIFGTIATRKLGAYQVTFWSYLIRLMLFSLYIPFALHDLFGLTGGTFLLNILLGLLLLVGFLAFNEGLRIASPSLVGTIAASFVGLVVVFSIVFLKESINSLQAFSIAVIFFGLLLAMLNFEEIRKGKHGMSRGVFLAFVAMVSWGIYFTFIKIPVKEIGWFWPNYISFMLFPLVFLFIKFKKIKLPSPNFHNALFPLVLAVILTGIAEFSFNFGISKGLTAIVAPIAGSYPTLFAILAFFVFKDKITRQQILGIIVTLMGIVGLSILSV